MNDLYSNESRAVPMASQLFLIDTNAHHEGFESLALTQAKFDAVRRPNATDWRHFLRLQGPDAAPRDSDVKSAAEMLAQLKWTPHEFTELLKVTRAQVGEASALALPMVYRRLQGQLQLCQSR